MRIQATSLMIGREKMAKQKIVLLGGRGMLGSDIAAHLSSLGLQFQVFDLPEFDITNPSQIESAIKKSDIVINCAAYTNVDKAESEKEPAMKVNANAVGALGSLALKHGVWVLHISTDFVFDGKLNRPYSETDSTNAISTYGKSKLEGEKMLIASGCHNCIIRIQWTYGKAGNNFVTKLLTKATEGAPMKVVDDQIGSPTSTVEAAKAVCDVIKHKPVGLFHYAADGYVSRFDMAKYIFEKLNLSESLSPCKTSDFKSPAQRPLNSCFNCSKIKSLLSSPIKAWQQPLEVFLKQL